MMNKLKGGIETIIAIVIVTGLVVALIISAVIPTANSGDKLLQAGVSGLANNQMTIGPKVGE